LNLFDTIRAKLASRPSSERTDWKWEFCQIDQMIEPQKGDDASLVLEDRAEQMKHSRPTGMRGMDRHSWAALTADLFRCEKGRDSRASRLIDSMLRGEHLQNIRCFIVLDEEGEFTLDGYGVLLGGSYSPGQGMAYLQQFLVDHPWSDARLLSSVSGPIET
ncbi:MAG: hypothetical protein AAB802_01980, partial [Patescibacteria group bacterium]